MGGCSSLQKLQPLAQKKEKRDLLPADDILYRFSVSYVKESRIFLSTLTPYKLSLPSPIALSFGTSEGLPKSHLLFQQQGG